MPLSSASGTSFTTTWVLQNNTGTSLGPELGRSPLRGRCGECPPAPGRGHYDLANTVEPGCTYNFSVPMIAPFTPGVYGEVWEVGQGGSIICQFYVYI